ncbi:parallel beta helix pectate lyase-like protein [Myroides indicus]|uniref:Parallel beta helix pectate lyase-like protein n=2 Tax=Myroides indicus TaxID=1323422 RepID=A0A4R7F9J7_9FLAO|nr:parallel beta helix pectate lyase-like protein [Myroides indicus]
MSLEKQVRCIPTYQNINIMNKIFFCLIFIVFSFISCKGQNSYNELAKQINSTIPQEYFQKRDELIAKGNELSTYLPFEHSKKGNVDYTKELQQGIDKGGVLVLPDYPLLVNEKGIQLKSNTKLVFREHSKLIMKPNAETHYTVLDLTDVENVDVYFANIEGDREEHLISKGEWGMGIRIQGSKNVNIYAPTITNCWGDGIYIRGNGKIQSKKISVNHFNIHRARRNGITIVSVDDLFLNNGLISDTNGTAPQSGIDIEPNRPTDILKNIIIKDITTYNSKGDGIMIHLAKLLLKQKEKLDPKVNITIENHKDIESLYAVRISGRSKDDSNSKYENSLKIDGEIVFKNSQWIWNKDDLPVRFSPKKDRVLEYGFNPKVKFENITILENNWKINSKQKYFVEEVLNKVKKL